MNPAKWLVPCVTVTRPNDRPKPARMVVRSFRLYAMLTRGANAFVKGSNIVLEPVRPAPSPAKIRAPG